MDDKKKSEKFAYISLILMIASIFLECISIVINQFGDSVIIPQNILLLILVPIYMTGFVLSILAMIYYRSTPAIVMFIVYIVVTFLIICFVIVMVILHDILNSCSNGCNGCLNDFRKCPG
jgi:hypothetical protein